MLKQQTLDAVVFSLPGREDPILEFPVQTLLRECRWVSDQRLYIGAVTWMEMRFKAELYMIYPHSVLLCNNTSIPLAGSGVSVFLLSSVSSFFAGVLNDL